MSCCDREKRIISKREHSVPVIKEDGSLLFKKVAPTMPGYVHDRHNPKLLRPDKVPCTERITLPVLRRNGKYEILNQCNHIECDHRGEEVNDEICGQCSMRNMPTKNSLRNLT